MAHTKAWRKEERQNTSQDTQVQYVCSRECNVRCQENSTVIEAEITHVEFEDLVMNAEPDAESVGSQ
jgi:hypothetical protein